MPFPSLEGFFSTRSELSDVVSICVEPSTIYIEELRGRRGLSFDFAIENRGSEDLELRFLKAVAYDSAEDLVTYRYVNRNSVGPSGIDTLGVSAIPAGETVDVYNPFPEWPADLAIARVRYTFTFVEKESRREVYVGDVEILPQTYEQETELQIPMKGLLTVIDGHDYLSHHRRFAMSLVRRVTNGAFAVNFGRFSFDFAVIGEDGNLAQMDQGEISGNRDFHFTNIRKSYTDGAPVFAPAAGLVVNAVNDLEDMYDGAFDTDAAFREGRVQDIAGNRVAIQHSEQEYSHLFHFKKGSLAVSTGDLVEQGQLLGEIGFSGTATVYSHLHYQLMDGADFLTAQALPVWFSEVTLVRGRERIHLPRTVPETGDFLLAQA